MRRRLFNLLALGSLLMLGIVVLFWVRSYGKSDYVGREGLSEIAELYSGDGLIQIDANIFDTKIQCNQPERFDSGAVWYGSFWPLERSNQQFKYYFTTDTVLGFNFLHVQVRKSIFKSDRWKITFPF